MHQPEHLLVECGISRDVVSVIKRDNPLAAAIYIPLMWVIYEKMNTLNSEKTIYLNLSHLDIIKRIRGAADTVPPKSSAMENAGHYMVSDFPIGTNKGVGKIILNCLVNRNIIGGPSTAEDILKTVSSEYHHFTASEFS